MEVLSQRKRRIYLATLTAIFIVVAPLTVLYASGYRLSSDFKIIKTGGIHVNVDTARAKFYLDDVFDGSGSIFQKSFFVQNLIPGVYEVRIEKENHYFWRKKFEVFPTMITEGHALLLPQEPILIPIPEILTDTDFEKNETRLRLQVPIQNQLYRETVAVFNATSTDADRLMGRATTTIQYQKATTTVYTSRGVGLWLDDGGLHAWWLKDLDDFPYVFCSLINECKREILVLEDGQDIKHFDFLPRPGLFVVLERSQGVVVTEIDIREPLNTQPLYLKPGARFRIIQGVIYILDDEELFELEL